MSTSPPQDSEYFIHTVFIIQIVILTS